MTCYTFTCEHFNYNNFTGDEKDVSSKHTVEFRADDLTTILEQFEMFLRGSGFHFDGQLDIVKQDEFENEQEHDNSAWQATVHSLMNPPKFDAVAARIASATGCEVCGLNKEMMKRHNCYDDNCPVYAPQQNIAEGC